MKHFMYSPSMMNDQMAFDIAQEFLRDEFTVYVANENSVEVYPSSGRPFPLPDTNLVRIQQDGSFQSISSALV